MQYGFVEAGPSRGLRDGPGISLLKMTNRHLGNRVARNHAAYGAGST
jgi:hypothetical protein